jgi:hypothetical protein
LAELHDEAATVLIELDAEEVETAVCPATEVRQGTREGLCAENGHHLLAQESADQLTVTHGSSHISVP